MLIFHGFGLNISSDIKLSPLIKLSNSDSLPIDLTITQGIISKKGLQTPNTKKLYIQATTNHLWLHVPKVAWFEVVNGNRIVYMPEPGADQQTLVLFLLGSCLGCILHQRHYLVMHANTIRFGNQCVLFAGQSGQGKSTLAAALHQRGLQVLADDISAINNQREVIPGYPQLKLWQDSAQKLNIEFRHLSKIRQQVNKFAYPLDHDSYCSKPLPLAAIYLLNTHSQDGFKKEIITGFNKFNPIKNNTYRPGYVKALDLQTIQLNLTSQLAKNIHLIRITRPKQTFQLEKYIDFILEDLQQLGVVA